MKIRQAAIHFKRHLGGSPTVKSVVEAIQNMGYNVVRFNTPEGDELIRSLGCEDKKFATNAFTLSGKVKFVFINDNLSTSDMLFALLHEAGHITLKHIGTGSIEWQDSRLMEQEAEAFAHAVMNQSNAFRNSMITFTICLVFFMLGYFLCNGIQQSKTNVEAGKMTDGFDRSTEQNTIDTVYITSTGEKYHLPECPYIKGKTISKMTKAQAEKIYKPCSICKP